MKKLILLVLSFSVLYHCGPKQDKVEKYMENGVEVVVNHLEPYKIEGEPSTLHLKEEFTIDFERSDLVEIGITKAEGFDVDSEGNIYVFQSSLLKENLVAKFDRNGNFVKSFLRKGQAPGEVQFPLYQEITANDEIPIVDGHGHKLLIFSKDGSLIKEIRLDSKYSGLGRVVPLENGNYLIEWSERVQSVEYFYIHLSLFNSEFEEIKELDRYKYVVIDWTNKFRWPRHVFIWNVSKRKIYVGNEDRGYEIWIYDLEGNLQRKIKKKYKPVKVPKRFKEEVLKEHEPSPVARKKLFFPKYMPPFQYSFTDDEGRLFVMTSEIGKNQKEYVVDYDSPMEYVYDIFNSDGVFIGKKGFKLYFVGRQYWVTMKKNRFYCFKKKDSGYKELVVYKMRWE